MATRPELLQLYGLYHQRRYVANIIQQAKREYYSTLLEENRNDVKAVFTIANNYFVEMNHSHIPLTDDKQKLANEFNEFFCKKVQTIMDNLQPIEEKDIDPHCIEMEYLTITNLMNLELSTRTQYSNPLINQQQNQVN